MRTLLFTFALAAGCATPTAVVGGHAVPRLNLDFVGQPFAIRVSAAHPDPGSPSGGLRAAGGRISGNVCGIDLAYYVDHAGDHTRLTGFLDSGRFESRIEVRDDADAIRREIRGAFAQGAAAVHLDVRVNHLRGVVGLRQFDLTRDGDDYVGSLEYVSATTVPRRVRAAAVIHGADALWSLPPAAQAAVLPTLLTCHGDALEDQLGQKFVVGFGGRQTWESSRVSAVYHVAVANQMTSPATSSQTWGWRAPKHDPIPNFEQGTAQ
jgi:hypothetical protein